MLETKHLLEPIDFPPLTRDRLETLQVNLGFLCNQSCIHCHVNAGPNRTEIMSLETVESVLGFVRSQGIRNLDLTGGAPELNPHFRYLVTQARGAGIHIIDRCNLTILEEPGQDNLAKFLAEHQVEVVASLPCYLEENVNAQRGKGVFQASILGLQKLCALGYGDESSGLTLNLVYNPQGPSLPPPQEILEPDYKQQLGDSYGIRFNRLLTITNMPIQRFGSTLLSKGQFNRYMDLLKDAYQPCNLKTVMCKSLLSVDWQGYVYDCDFNQMLNMPLTDNRQRPLHLSRLHMDDLTSRPIRVAGHCYGCAAGQGSSCGGALS